MVFRRPKRYPLPVPPPQVEGKPPLMGDRVTHERHGPGRFQWYEWHDAEGNWVVPLERDGADGQWLGVVAIPHGSYMVPLTELKYASPE
jgi:hypothetical protein